MDYNLKAMYSQEKISIKIYIFPRNQVTQNLTWPYEYGHGLQSKGKNCGTYTIKLILAENFEIKNA